MENRIGVLIFDDKPHAQLLEAACRAAQYDSIRTATTAVGARSILSTYELWEACAHIAVIGMWLPERENVWLNDARSALGLLNMTKEGALSHLICANLLYSDIPAPLAWNPLVTVQVRKSSRGQQLGGPTAVVAALGRITAGVR